LLWFGVYLERKIEYRQLVYILALFMLVQLFGMLVVYYFMPPSVVYQMESQPVQPQSPLQAVYFLLYIVAGTAILLLFFKFYHGAVIYSLIEGIVVVSASFYLFLIILSSIFPQQSATYFVIAASLVIPILLMLAKYKRPQLRNTVAMIASIGAGIVLGLVFSFFVAFIFMAIIAAYDYISVFITRHMLALGKQAVERNMALLIGASDVELVPKSYLSSAAVKDFKKHFKVSSVHNKEVKSLIKKGAVPIPMQAALGTGDLAIPLMLAVSAYIYLHSYFISSVIVFGAVIGLVFTMYMLKTYKIALPAIPPLFSFICIAMGVAFVAIGLFALSLALFLTGIGVVGVMLATVRRVYRGKGRSVF